MSEKIAVHIITPERVVFARNVDSLIVPGQVGEMQILHGHVALFSIIKPGEVVAQDGEERMIYVVGAGFLEVSHDKVSLLVDTAEGASDIDVAQAQAIIDAAQDKLKDIDSVDVEERFAFETQLATARAQVEVYRRAEDKE